MTPVQAQTLALYRSRHAIKVIVDRDELIRALDREVCETCGIRVHRLRDGRWRHDVSEVRALSRTPVIDWTIR